MAFNRVQASNHARQLSVAEFKMGLAVLAKWGIVVPREDVHMEFQTCNNSGSGLITFDEFCDCSRVAHSNRDACSAKIYLLLCPSIHRGYSQALGCREWHKCAHGRCVSHARCPCL